MSKKDEALSLNHDLRNHIGIAYGHLELLPIIFPELEKDTHLSYARNGMERAIELSKNLSLSIDACMENMDIALHNPATSSALTSIHVQDYLTNIVSSVYEKLSEIYDIKINISFSLIQEEKHVSMNTDSLQKARENIIGNAINAGATQIDINFEMKEYCVIATFTDNGKGMTQEELDKVILSQSGDGVLHGLGTKSIIKASEEHGFILTYLSNPGEGATVRLLIPYT